MAIQRERVGPWGIVAACAACSTLLGAGALPDSAAREEIAPGLRCAQVMYRHVQYDVVWVDPAQCELRLYWQDESGEALGQFRNLERHLAARGKRLLFAMNSGIYARDHTPLGLHVAEGRELKPLNRRRGGGNFFLKPNGVFYVDASGAAGVLETEAYHEAAGIAPRLAVQSGPLLLEKGAPHPRFIPGSSSRNIRNGVGVDRDGQIVFAISRLPVNFDDFAHCFLEALNCPDALYLDGSLSAMYLPECGRRDRGTEFAGMLAVVAPASAEAADGED